MYREVVFRGVRIFKTMKAENNVFRRFHTGGKVIFTILRIILRNVFYSSIS